MDPKFIVIFSIILIVVDIIWIGVINKNTWNNQIIAVQKEPAKMRPVYGLLCYIVIVASALYFVQSGINRDNYKYNSLVKGFLFGFSLYAVYDFTCLAIFNDYRLDIAIMDMVWGGLLIAFSLFITNHYWYQIKN